MAVIESLSWRHRDVLRKLLEQKIAETEQDRVDFANRVKSTLSIPPDPIVTIPNLMGEGIVEGE